jgi:hypothetical protein
MYELCAETLGCRSIQRVDTPLIVSLLATLFITGSSVDSGGSCFSKNLSNCSDTLHTKNAVGTAEATIIYQTVVHCT